MQFEVPSSIPSMDQVVDQILLSCQITDSEKNQLHSILSSPYFRTEEFTEEHRDKVRRVFYGLRHGLITTIY